MLHTLGDLFPGVHATDTRRSRRGRQGRRADGRRAAQAVRDRQAVPKRDIIVDAEGIDVPLARDAILRARDRARSPAGRTTWPAQAVRHRAAHRLRRCRGPGAQPPARRGGPALRRAPAVGRAGCQRRARQAVAAAHPGKAAAPACCGHRKRSGPPLALSWIIPNGSGLPAPITRRAGRWRTSPCSTRPPSCSASTTPRSRRRAARPSAPARRAGVRAGGTRIGHVGGMEFSMTVSQLAECSTPRGCRNRDGRRPRWPPPSAPRPTGPGPTAT